MTGGQDEAAEWIMTNGLAMAASNVPKITIDAKLILGKPVRWKDDNGGWQTGNILLWPGGIWPFQHQSGYFAVMSYGEVHAVRMDYLQDWPMRTELEHDSSQVVGGV